MGGGWRADLSTKSSKGAPIMTSIVELCLRLRVDNIPGVEVVTYFHIIALN